VTLIPLLAATLLLASLNLTMLAASAALARLGGDRRAAVEATLLLESALAHARVEHAAALSALANGERASLAVTVPPGWTATAAASREATGDLLWLQVEVERRNHAGVVQAAGRGTLILGVTAADTAIVIDSRPRF
jgi:hypothetical protein